MESCVQMENLETMAINMAQVVGAQEDLYGLLDHTFLGLAQFKRTVRNKL